MAESGVADELSLRQLFEAGWEAQRKVESGQISSNTDDYKVLVVTTDYINSPHTQYTL